MNFHIITLFPEFFTSPLQTGVLGSAISTKIINVETHHLVDFKESQKRVDDTPFGGGAGMLIRPEPLALATENILKDHTYPVVHFTPRGKKLTQSILENLVKKHDGFILVCGRYEGVDQRYIDTFVDYEFSVGEVIVSGGEYPALYFIDSISRLVPGMLGNDESHDEESFSKNLGRKKEYPHYTRPEEWRGQKVPDVLLSGHHKKIDEWRKRNVK